MTDRKTIAKSHSMTTPKVTRFHSLNFVRSFGYSLILHAIFGVVVLFSFPVRSMTLDRPVLEYIMVMLPEKTEVMKEPEKLKVQPEKPKPLVVKKAEPLPKEPEPPKPPPQEEPPPPPAEPEPPPQEPEPVVTPEPPPPPVVPVQEPEAQPAPPVEPEPVVETPPPAPEPVLPLEEPTPPPPPQEVAPPPPTPEPPPLVAEAAPIEPEYTEPAPPPVLPALPPAVNLPKMPSPEPEPPIVISKAEEAKGEPEPEVPALSEPPALEEPVSKEPAAPVIVVTEPQEGATLDATQGNTVTVRGTIDDPEIKTATVILNGVQFQIEVQEGRFETVISNLADENMLLVEATNKAGLTGQSPLVRFLTTRPEPRDVEVILSCKASCGDVRLTAFKGEHPQSVRYLPFRPSLEIESSTLEYQNGSPYLARLMVIRQTESGIYTIRLDPHPPQMVSDCDPHLVVILYGYRPDRIRTRVFWPSAVSQAGAPWITARFLMPQGFFWEDDDWTTGQIEDSRNITKFSSTLGLVWKELK